MKTTTKMRLFGGLALLLIFFVTAGLARGQGLAPLYLLFALTIGYELLIVRPVGQREAKATVGALEHAELRTSYVADAEANRQLVLLRQLASKGMSPEQMVDEFHRQQIPCLIPGQTWTASLMEKLIDDFSLNRVPESTDGGKRTAEQTPAALAGLGGWLVLVIFGLVIGPIRIAHSLATIHWPILRDGAWNELTTVGTASYHPLWAPLLTFEVVGNLATIVLAAVTLVLLFRRSKRTPLWAITWLSWVVGFVVADFFLADLIPDVAAQADSDSVKEVVRALVAAAIWIPYFLVSKRVKATFVR